MLEDCIFDHNRCMGLSGSSAGHGSGIFILQDATVTATRCQFRDNEAASYGAAVCLWGAFGSGAHLCTASLSECDFIENSAGHGGAIACYGAEDARVALAANGCVFRSNGSVGNNLGGALSCHSGTTYALSNCTFFENEAYWGGCLYLTSSLDLSPAGSFANCIVAENICTAGNAIRCTGQADPPTLTCCDLFGNEPGPDWGDCIADQEDVDGNISLDPEFCDPDQGDLTISDTSPCRPFSEPNPECDLIGALPVRCGPTGVASSECVGGEALWSAPLRLEHWTLPL